MSQVIVKVPLTGPEYAALLVMAREECRTPFDHLRWLLKCEATRHQLLPTSTILFPSNEVDHVDHTNCTTASAFDA